MEIKKLADAISTAISDHVINICETNQATIQPLPHSRTRVTRTKDDVSDRKMISKKKDNEKLQFLRQLETQFKNVDEKENVMLTEAARIFRSQTLKPILHCWRDHFESDIGRFETSWSTIAYRHTKFSKVCNEQKCLLLT